MAGLTTVLKLGPLLDLFTLERHTWGVSEVAEALAMPRSSAHALLISLVEIGLLQTRGRGRYSIGWRVLELGEVLRSRTDLRTLAAPVLEDLVRSHGETTHLAVMDRKTVLYVDKVQGTHNIVVQGARVGARLEPHCTAVGKVLMANMDRARVEEHYADRQLQRYTATTITDLPALLTELDEVKKSGVGFDRGEQLEEIHCVAVPVRDEMGAVVAALSISVPVNRFAAKQAELITAARASATEIQRRITHALDQPADAVSGTPDVREFSPGRSRR